MQVNLSERDGRRGNLGWHLEDDGLLVEETITAALAKALVGITTPAAINRVTFAERSPQG